MKETQRRKAGVMFKFQPYEHVTIPMLDNHKGRVTRCIFDGGMNIYNVMYIMNGEAKSVEFYEDEIEKI
jgi:hypothetical protein